MPTTPGQRIWQGRFEALIGVAAPAFDLLLNAGDRASRLLLSDDSDYYPIRPRGGGVRAGRGAQAQGSSRLSASGRP